MDVVDCCICIAFTFMLAIPLILLLFIDWLCISLSFCWYGVEVGMREGGGREEEDCGGRRKEGCGGGRWKKNRIIINSKRLIIIRMM